MLRITVRETVVILVVVVVTMKAVIREQSIYLLQAVRIFGRMI